MNTFYGSVLHIYAFLTHRCLKFQMEASRILRVYGSSSISKELFWSVEFAATFSQISEYHELWQPTPRFLNIMNSGNPLNPTQYPCLENLMDRGAWQATVHGVTNSRTWLSTHGHCLPSQTNIQAKRDSLWLWRTAQILATQNTSIQISQVILLICHPLPPFF